ncbi:protein PAXX-like [Hoplias malabaricus]|uniref:protein PAXX-like n=1 Tax=Hoplias malabaricus TaxID=27720 RepID=UPI0034622648
MDQTVSQSRTLLCTWTDQKDRSQYVCFTHKKAEGIGIGLSNGEEVWKADLSEESLSQFKKKLSLKSTEDYALKLKGACKSGSAYVSLQEDSAVLHLGSDSAELSLSFSKLTDHEGRTELKDLLFKMADSLTQLESADSTPTLLPVKSLHKKNTGFEPRNQNNGPTVTVRKRLPGDSLINPGTRRKRPATGVDFYDEDEA